LIELSWQVRDFTLSAHSSAELQQRQLDFAQALIDGASADDSSRSGVAVREYCNTLLHFHAQAGATSPLHLEPRIVAWLLHKDSTIVDQLMQGLPSSDVANLAAWLGSEAGRSEDWKSAQVYYILALQGKVRQAHSLILILILILTFSARTSTATEQASYFRHCIAATDKIPEGSQSGALDMAFMARQRLVRFSGNQNR
jgi:hypothetical protein